MKIEIYEITWRWAGRTYRSFYATRAEAKKDLAEIQDLGHTRVLTIRRIVTALPKTKEQVANLLNRSCYVHEMEWIEPEEMK